MVNHLHTTFALQTINLRTLERADNDNSPPLSGQPNMTLSVESSRSDYNSAEYTRNSKDRDLIHVDL